MPGTAQTSAPGAGSGRRVSFPARPGIHACLSLAVVVAAVVVVGVGAVVVTAVAVGSARAAAVVEVVVAAVVGVIFVVHQVVVCHWQRESGHPGFV